MVTAVVFRFICNKEGYCKGISMPLALLVTLLWFIMSFNKTKKIFFIGAVYFVFFVLANNSLAATGVTIPTDTGLPNPIGKDPVITVAESFMKWLLRIVGILAIIAFIVSGLQYITSAGNERQIETAKRNMMWSIVGLMVALISLIIVITINAILEGNTRGF